MDEAESAETELSFGCTLRSHSDSIAPVVMSSTAMCDVNATPPTAADRGRSRARCRRESLGARRCSVWTCIRGACWREGWQRKWWVCKLSTNQQAAKEGMEYMKLYRIAGQQTECCQEEKVGNTYLKSALCVPGGANSW